ncbi:MAG: xanthine dehydrogenase family protein subunit M [Dongiaceae bacterium]
MIPGRFDYHLPRSMDEALAMLAQYGEDARPLAGGHSLIPMMKLRLAEPAHLIDLRGLGDLKGIREASGRIRIGAMTTQAEVIASALLAEKCPILPEASALIADPQVRYVGTVGGNVANGDPGNDLPAVMMALGADFVLRGKGGERTVAAKDFYEGTYATALKPGELLAEVHFPAPLAGHGYAYRKMKRKVGDYAIAAAAVVLNLKGGTCERASIALTNLGPTPIFAAAAGQALAGTKLDAAAVERAVGLAVALAEPATDMRGPADFRRHVAGVMTRRAIETARDRAKGA